MALLKLRKEDLITISEELGLKVEANLTKVGLKKLIEESPEYDEDLIKELIGAVQEERERKEKREERERKEKWEERERKEKREERERREDKERQRKYALELEKIKSQERENIEKMRCQRKIEIMKMQSSVKINKSKIVSPKAEDKILIPVLQKNFPKLASLEIDRENSAMTRAGGESIKTPKFEVSCQYAGSGFGEMQSKDVLGSKIRSEAKCGEKGNTHSKMSPEEIGFSGAEEFMNLQKESMNSSKVGTLVWENKNGHLIKNGVLGKVSESESGVIRKRESGVGVPTIVSETPGENPKSRTKCCPLNETRGTGCLVFPNKITPFDEAEVKFETLNLSKGEGEDQRSSNQSLWRLKKGRKELVTLHGRPLGHEVKGRRSPPGVKVHPGRELITLRRITSLRTILGGKGLYLVLKPQPTDTRKGGTEFIAWTMGVRARFRKWEAAAEFEWICFDNCHCRRRKRPPDVRLKKGSIQKGRSSRKEKKMACHPGNKKKGFFFFDRGKKVRND